MRKEKTMHGASLTLRTFSSAFFGAVLALVLSPSPASAASLTVGSVSATCGGQISVPVAIDNAAGLLAAQFRVAFDATKLTAKPATTGPVTAGFSISSNAAGGVLIVALASGSPASSGGGVVANLSFTVSAGVAAGAIPLTISTVLLNDVASAGQSGSVSVSCGSPDPDPDPDQYTWLLTSSARVQGVGAFWTTDLTIRNAGTSTASVTIKFLGHGEDGRQGPEVVRGFAAGESRTFTDVLNSLFSLESDYGPILVTSTVPEMAILGLTSTPGGDGTYGQSVPAVGADSFIGLKPRSIAAVRQDANYRTNLMLANASETSASIDVQLVSSAGTVLASKRATIGPLSRAQFNVATDFGQANVADAAFVLSSPGGTPSIAAYAALIDSKTGDPRTLLPQ